VSRNAFAIPLQIMGHKLHPSDQGGKMQNLQDIQRDSSSAPLDVIGGEPLAGSGFDAEETDSGFFSNDQVEE
jgi:hypothetical protein